MSFLEEVLREVPVGGRPADIECEERVLGALIADPAQLDEPQAQALTPEDFYRGLNAELFRVLRRRGATGLACAVLELEAALPTLREHRAWLMEMVDNGRYLDWRWAAGRVRVNGLARRAQAGAVQLWKGLRELGSDAEPETVVERATTLLEGLEDPGTMDVSTVGDLAPAFITQLDDALQGKLPPAMPTGFATLDNLLGGGFHPGEVTIIGARPSCGKSSLARGIAAQLALTGHTTLFISLEVPRAQIYRDLVTGYSHVPAQVLRSGRLSDTQRERALEAWETVSEMGEHLRITDKPRQLDDILGTVRAQVRRAGVRVVMVDYLQLVTHQDSRLPRREQVAAVSRAFKELALKQEVQVVALAQLVRDVDKGDRGREPRMSDLKESGDIEQDADSIFLLHRPDKQAEQTGKAAPYAYASSWKDTEVIVAKNRMGPIGRVMLRFHGPSMTFHPPEDER